MLARQSQQELYMLCKIYLFIYLFGKANERDSHCMKMKPSKSLQDFLCIDSWVATKC